MNENVLLCFPPGAERLKDLDTSCSVSFLFVFCFFFNLFFWLFHEACYRKEKQRTGSMQLLAEA